MSPLGNFTVRMYKKYREVQYKGNMYKVGERGGGKSKKLFFKLFANDLWYRIFLLPSTEFAQTICTLELFNGLQ